MRQLRPKLYDVTFDWLDYNVGYELYSKQIPMPAGCSVVQNGNIIGRNLDWTRDDHVEVIVHTKAHNGRFSTVGVAHSSRTMTESNIGNGLCDLDDVLLLPFLLSDGMNENGVYCSVNVVPAGDKEDTKIVGTTGEKMCQLMLPRYICDYATCADHALTLLEDVQIYPAIAAGPCHLYISDGEKSYAVEFIDGEMSVIETDALTNFYLTDWNGTVASKVMGNTDEEIAATGLTDHAMGLERWNIIQDGKALATSVDAMASLMHSLAYSKSYDVETDPFWYSEFYTNTESYGDLTLYSTAEEMAPYIQAAIARKEWITCHTSVYDLSSKTLRVISNEEFGNPFNLIFTPEKASGIANIEFLYDDNYHTV